MLSWVLAHAPLKKKNALLIEPLVAWDTFYIAAPKRTLKAFF